MEKIGMTPFYAEKEKTDISKWNMEQAEVINYFHRSFQEYKETPLCNLKNLARELSVENILVKDESYRFGLNAFKVLGGSYAVACYIAKQLHRDMKGMTYSLLTDENVKEKLGHMTFITATDGNHGRGIAWTADRLGQRCVVYMPKGSAAERLANIRRLGADASITDLSYDDAVQKAKADAEENGWVLVQDTAWDGYEEIPSYIMQGYLTMSYEALAQMQAENIEMPTHIFLQAGVGSMSGALTAFFANIYQDSRQKPIIVIVEPHKADCIYQTAKANDGMLHSVTGKMDTIMAGLACGVPCTVGWNIMRDYADYAITIPDAVAAKGMRVLANPIGEDSKVVSGESGASTLGTVVEILSNPVYKDIKDELRLNENSRILCFSTEGATDKENYRRIVWDGAYSSEPS